MPSLLAQTKAVLRQYGLRPQKRLGQNFLVDDNIMNKILAAAQITPEDTVLEIGPGTGALTQALLSRARQVIAVEYDKGLYGYLNQRYQDNPKLVLVHGDYLKIDLTQLLFPSPPAPLPGGEGRYPHPCPLSRGERGREEAGEDTLVPLPTGEGYRKRDKVKREKQEPHGKLPDYLLQLCREYRRNPTETESMLWACLRDRQLHGLKFRRQYPIGRYIADFYCHEHKLVIEVDGGIHLKKDQKLYDAARQEDIEGQGYQVLRVTTEEVQIDLEGILNKIVEVCISLSISPLPPGEGLGVREKREEIEVKLKVVSNLPYYISTPLLLKLIDERRYFDYAVLMLQKEVVARLAARPGTKDYGALTLAVALYARVETIATVSRNCFYPAPEVDSALIKLSFREKPAVELKDEALFKQIVRAAFGQRRKTLANALNAVFEESRGEVTSPLQDALKAAGIDGKRRGETLSLGEFARLSNALAGW